MADIAGGPKKVTNMFWETGFRYQEKNNVKRGSEL